jgi:toxin ParE1/3/4
MSLSWSPEAIDDLVQLRAYIAADNPFAAQEVVLRILHAVEVSLQDNPSAGRPGRVPGTREFVVQHTSYIVPYRVRGSRIEILRVYHGRRRWPDRF